MADVKINDLTTAAVSGSMQLETDISGTLSNKISISDLTAYLASNLPFEGFTWSIVTTSIAMQSSNGYITNSVSTINFTLPTTAAVGDTFRVVNFSAGGWQINQNAGQTVYFGTQATTTGVGGYCASTQLRDSVEIICVTANTDFVIIAGVGNINLM